MRWTARPRRLSRCRSPRFLPTVELLPDVSAPSSRTWTGLDPSASTATRRATPTSAVTARDDGERPGRTLLGLDRRDPRRLLLPRLPDRGGPAVSGARERL